jgi:hypothetical protein
MMVLRRIKMDYRTLVCIAALLFFTKISPAQALEVGTCTSIWTSGPGIGASYRGTFENGDYRFAVKVPPGLIGWGGVADGAPFHRFVIYLDPKICGESCIGLYVGIHLDLPEDRTGGNELLSGTRRRVGNRAGTQQVIRGVVGGKKFENILIELQLTYKEDRNDFGITLVTPTSLAKKTRPIFERFVSSLRFQ